MAAVARLDSGLGGGALITGMLASSLSGVIRQASGEVPAVRTLLEAIGGGAQVDRALVLIFYVLVGVLAACAGIQTMLRARQEESHGTAEIVWSTPITRVRWLGGFITVAVIAALVTLAAAIAGSALGLASAASAATGSTDAAGLWQASYLAATVQGAAAVVLIAFGALAVALVPRAAIALSWLALVVTLSLGLFGPLFQFPDWLVHLSPFALAVPGLAGSSGSWGPVWLLVVGAAVGCALALWRMRCRELGSE